jgi:enterochelin esterase-like enzyme
MKPTLSGLLILPSLAFSTPEVRLPKPPAGYDRADASIPKGNLSQPITFPIRGGGSGKYRIHLPPGYSASRPEKYPVLYLHHGIGGDENAWVTGEGSADRVMDWLYAKADPKVTPMIVVMPNGKGPGNDPFGAWEGVLLGDLIPHIEKTYNASSDPDLRGIAGLSMGGGQTLNFGFKNFEVFTWIGSFSPAPNTIAAATTIKDPAAVKASVHFSFLAAGTAETMFLTNARNYHKFLDDNGIGPHMMQVEEGLNHEKENWNRSLHNFAQRIFKVAATRTLQPPRESAARGASTAASIPFLVRRGEGSSLRIFSLDGRGIPIR